jgi:hypothetical protein
MSDSGWAALFAAATAPHDYRSCDDAYGGDKAAAKQRLSSKAMHEEQQARKADQAKEQKEADAQKLKRLQAEDEVCVVCVSVSVCQGGKRLGCLLLCSLLPQAHGQGREVRADGGGRGCVRQMRHRTRTPLDHTPC